MKITTTVKASELLAIALFVEKRPVDAQFGGVNVDLKDCVIRLVATDGSNLATLRIDMNRTYKGMNDHFTIPINLIKNIKKSNPSGSNPVTITFDSDYDSVKLEQSDQQFIGKVVQGAYVRWRGAIPAPFEPVFDIYKLTPLVMFEKAAVLLKSTAVFYHNCAGVGVAHIPLNEDRLFIGLVQKAKLKCTDARTIKPMEESYYG